MIDLRQNANYSKYLKRIGWEVEEVTGVKIFLKKIPALGYFTKIQRPEKIISFDSLMSFRKTKRIFSLMIEPGSQKQLVYYINHGFRLSKSPSLPSKTIHIDLTKSLDKLKSGMHQKTRYNIKLSEKRGVKILASNDILKFVGLWHQSARKRGFFFSLKSEILNLYESFGKNAILLFADYKKETVSALFTIFTKDCAYYMYAASTPYGNKLFAPSLVTWESIKIAKQRNVKVYDFEGIYDERFPLNSWKGFSRFKKGFGGKIVEYPGPVRLMFLPFY